MRRSRCNTCPRRRSSGSGWRWRRSPTTSSSSASCRRRTWTTRGTQRRSTACEQAKTLWVQATSRKAEGVEAYKIEYARDQDAFPDPKWPTRTLDELLEVTFRNANIDTDNHPGSAPPDRREAGSGLMPQDGFRTIVVVDFEYEIDDGDLPRVLCMVAYVLDANLRHVGTIRLWRGEFGSTPPFDIGPDTLFVAYSAWAEMTCFLSSAGGFRCTSTICTPPIWRPAISCCRTSRTRSARSSASACRTPAAPTASRAGRTSTSRKWPRRSAKAAGANTAARRCCNIARRTSRNSAELLRRQLTGYGNRAPVDPGLVMHWSELQRQDRRPDPGPRHADRHAAVESGAGEQASGHRRADPAVRSEPGQRESDLFAGWRMGQRPVRSIGWCRVGHRRMAAAGLRRARAGRRRLPHDVRRTPGDRRAARAARQSRRHRARPNSDRPRRAQPAEPVSVRHRDRPQCAGQEPVQRPRQHALVHEVSGRQDRALSRLANPGGRHCGGAQRRCGAGGGLSVRRHLSRAREDVRPDQRYRHQALEERASRASASA